MPYKTNLANALRNRGLRVEEYGGWTTRGSSSFTPRVAVCHWTAGPCGSTGRPSLNVVVNGRAGLAGPLAQVYLDRSGIAVVVAAGRANHAGVGGWKGVTGNTNAFGCEAECCNAGDWTAAQRSEYPKVVAAFCDVGGFGADMVCGHNEWSPGRKIDIYDWDMNRMRSEVATILGGGVPIPPPQPTADCIGSRNLKLTSPYMKGGDVTRLQQRLAHWGHSPGTIDGVFGNNTDKATRSFQGATGLSVDGIAGPNTRGKLCTEPGAPAPTPPPAPAPSVPAFPFPSGHWMGVASSNPKNHSGYYAADRPGISQYQSRMQARGWSIGVDGKFGTQTQDVTIKYQREKGLPADGLAGEQTWHSIWTAPVT